MGEKSEFGSMLEDFDDVEFLEDVGADEGTGDGDDAGAGDAGDTGGAAGNEDDNATDGDSRSANDEESPEIVKLRADLEATKSTLAAIVSGKAKKEESSNDAPKGFQLTEVEYANQNFVADDFDIEQLTPESLNTMLNSAAKSAAQTGAKHAAEQVLLAIPGIVKHNVTVQGSIQDAVRSFYSSNKDLLKFKGAVATVAEELASKNPDWEIPKLFEEAGKESRKRLGIKKPVGRKVKGAAAGDIGVRGQQGRSKSGIVKGMEKEIGDMLNTQ